MQLTIGDETTGDIVLDGYEPPKPEGKADDVLDGYEPPEPGGWDDYPLDNLAIRNESRTAVDVVRRIDQGRFVMDPDFQRGYVWDAAKQSRLMESILLRIPLPVFYVAEDKGGLLIVVDGRQRLTTIRRFLNREFRLRLPDRRELDGKRFDELDPRLQNRVEDCQLLFYIIDHSVPERARLDIFERVNGGEVLTRQQMRNAIYNGPATRFLREEAETELFVSATGRSLNPSKMQDREFVNRFVAFSLLELQTYRGDMDKWLADGLLRLAGLSTLEKERLRERFRRALENNLEVFGKHSFRKHQTPDQERSVLNASLFDVMAQTLADRTAAEVKDRADALREAFYTLMEDKEFEKAITYSPNSTKPVLHRFEIASRTMDEVFGAQ